MGHSAFDGSCGDRHSGADNTEKMHFLQKDIIGEREEILFSLRTNIGGRK